jgi:hypothetical protein
MGSDGLKKYTIEERLFFELKLGHKLRTSYIQYFNYAFKNI